MRPPAFQFYPDDFIGGTCDLTTLEVGAYIRLLCYQWSRGKIPSKKTKLKLISGCEVSRNVLGKFHAGKNARLEIVRKRQEVWREKSRIGGQHSAQKRAMDKLQPPLEPPLEPNGQPKGNTPSPSPSPSPYDKAYNKGEKALNRARLETATSFEKALGDQWVNDAGKWVNRIKSMPGKSERVIAEVELAQREKRIKTSAAQYAEQVWKEFK